MSEALSGLVQQAIQQSLENKAVNQQQPQQKTGGRSFESYMQQDQNTEAVKPATTSGVQIEQKLQQLQSELTTKIKDNSSTKIDPNQFPKEMLDGKSRLGLLKEAYSEMSASSELTNGFENRFVQLETEYKQVEALMQSDKNLSQGELLALQARLYQVSQHIEVMSKVVDQMAGGIKTVLNTNI